MKTPTRTHASQPLLTRRIALLGGLASLATLPVLRPARAAGGTVLIMVEEPGCQYCRQFNAEIGPGYARSPEGRFAPLVRVHRRSPELRGLAHVTYTPTFIVMRHGEEVGRISGYPGADYFYPELDGLLSRAGFSRRGSLGQSSV